MTSIFLALMLLAGSPPSDAAISTAPVAPEQPAEVKAADLPLPDGAPADNFGLVAWCHGVLSGHMDLAERIQSVEPLDEVQQKIGSFYLDSYVKALAGAAEGRTAAGRKRAEKAEHDGWSKWDPARKADLQLARDTYLSWQLPGRCEHAAIELSGDKDLFRMTPTSDEMAAQGTDAPIEAHPQGDVSTDSARPVSAALPQDAGASTTTKTDDAKSADDPKKGHLLPSWLRFKHGDQAARSRPANGS